MRKLKEFRIWSVLLAGLVLRVLPEQFKGQHRVGEVTIWASSFPRAKS